MVRQKEVNALDIAVMFIGCAISSLVLQGCGPTTGWKVEFGVSPVTSRHDEAGLNTKELRNGSGSFETKANY